MEINITITGIEQFTEAVALLASAIAYEKGMELTGQAAKKLIPETVTKTAPAVTEKATKVTETDENVTENEVPQETDITIEDVRAAFMAKNTKANTPKLKKILTDFGVKKVTDLEEKDFEAVLKALEEI